MNGYIDFDCLKRFYNIYNSVRSDDEIILVMRRIDREGKGKIT